MKPLATTQQMLSWAGVCPNSETTNKRMNKITIAFSSIIILSEVYVSSACAFLFSKYVSIDLEASLYALFQMSGHTVALYGFLYIIFTRRKIVDIFNKLTAIFETSNSTFRCNLFSLGNIPRPNCEVTILI